MEFEVKGDLKAPTKDALQHFIETIIKNVSPKLLSLNNIYKELETSQDDGNGIFDTKKNNMDLFMLCSDQILKCACLMADIFKREITHSEIIKESREWVMDRIIWCLKKIEKLNTISDIKITTDVDKFENLTDDDIDLNTFDNDGFITWTDETLKILEMLEKLFVSDLESSTFKNSNNELWKNECASGVLSFHKVIRQLVFSAMDICQNCLAEDQRIVSARCHVVLRESKNLIEEILDNPKFAMGESDDLNIDSIKIKKKLHYPTVKMFIDVLKEAVYSLETSINRGVLLIVLKCMMNPVEPLDNLIKLCSNLKLSRNGINNHDGNPNPAGKIEDDEKSALIKEFDIHSEQIIQIGLFAISCSTDKQRVLQLKSCLASLEIIEIHLIPIILSNPNDLHTQFMIDHWINEIKLLRNSVYLIVDPVAFIDIVLENSRENMKELKKMDCLDRKSTKYLIDVGRCVLDYFTAYFKWEPQVLEKYTNLKSLTNDLSKVVNECQTVVELFLSTKSDNAAITTASVNNKNKKNQDVRIMKRFKLLHSLLTKISNEFVEENHTFDFESERLSLIQSYSENTPPEKNNTYHISKKAEIPPPKNKGIFKMFDMFKGFTKTDYKNNDATSMVKKNSNKTMSRSSIIRPSKKIQHASKSNFENNSFKPILKRLKDINDTIVEKSLHDVFSASGIFNYLDEEYILANVSIFDNLDTTNNAILQNTLNKSETARTRPNTFYKKTSRRKHGASLRRRVLINRANTIHNMTNEEEITPEVKEDVSLKSRSIESLNKSLDLHITDILEQITTLSDTISLLKIDYTPEKKSAVPSSPENPNILTLKINETPKKNCSINIFNQKVANKTTDVTPKKVWNIKVSDDKENIMTPVKLNDTKNKLHIPDVDCDIDVSFGSDIATPERMNDLNLLEKKLNELKQFWEK